MRRDKPPSVRRRAIAQTLVAIATMLSGGALLAADKSPAAPPSSTTGAAPAKKPAKVVLVDINSASRAQLRTLPEIGDAEATRIIAGRPYLSKADLASKNVIPTGVYLSIKSRIVALQKQEPKRKQ
jgi:DNA uptake protein ComE-like DNA-binding protein